MEVVDGVSREFAFVALHRPQLEASGVPERYWSSLRKKLDDGIFDAGRFFSLLQIEYDEPRRPEEPARCVRLSRPLKAADPRALFLVDHAWTFRAEDARRQLRRMPELRERIAAMAGLPEDADVDEVHAELYRYAHFYSPRSQNSRPEHSAPVWYVDDELGSAVAHSDEPNFRMVPFLRSPDGDAYSLLFPLRDVEEGETVTRDFLEALPKGDRRRDAALLPWRRFEPTPEEEREVVGEPDEAYFRGGRVEESLPDVDRVPPLKTTLRVYTENPAIARHLSSPRFAIVDDERDADALWFSGHFKNYRELAEASPDKFVNQFPFEHVLTTKDLLAAVSRRKKDASWALETYNLRTELVPFVVAHRRRVAEGADARWICKPFNLARGLDTHISDDLKFVARLSLAGPKIAQKYVETPALFRRPDSGERVKFDVRYVLLLESVRPLVARVYRNFFLRFANRPFAMSDFDEYERHFTVMNYVEGAPLYRLLCDEFVREWDAQYPAAPWASVEPRIFAALREALECATAAEPPRGLAPNGQSRALYAADLMLAREGDPELIQPKLLEVNWMPDCDRACQYYPDFYDDVFSSLFLGEHPDTCVPI